MRALLPAFLLVVPGLAQAATPACLTADEFSAVSIYALPAMLRGAVQRCDDVLPAGAFLRTDGENLARRYARGREAQWPLAKRAVLKAGGSFDPQAGPVLHNLPDETLKPLVDDMVISVVDQRLPPDRCGSIDRLVMLLSPLPAPLMAQTIALATGVAAHSGEQRLGPMRLCRA